MDWGEHINRRNRVVKVIEGYQCLKGLYLEFLDNFKEIVSLGKEYAVSITSVDETHLTLKVLDDLINMSFSFVAADRIVYGKLTFERSATENPEHILTLFFDDYGAIKHSAMTAQYVQNLRSKQGAGFVLLLLLDRYINLPRFKANDETLNGTGE